MISINKQRGFSLLEAIVSLVILSGVLVASFTWFDSILTATHKANQKLKSDQIAYSFLAELNPSLLADDTKGVSHYGDYLVRWKAEPIDTADGVMTNGVSSAFKLSLFEVKFDVSKDDSLISSYKTRKVGFKKRVARDGGSQ